MMKRPASLILLVAVLAIVSSCGERPTTETAGTIIVVAEPDWQGARAIGHVLAAVMEGRLGLDVEMVKVTSADKPLDAMAENGGSIDVYPDLWMPDQAEAWQLYIEVGSAESIVVNTQPYTGTEGIYVPGYVQDEHGIHHVEDLAKAETAVLFDNDGDGKGDFWPGPPDWNSTRIQLVKAESYGYAQFFDPLKLTDDDFAARLAADYEQKKAILFYYWTPAWIHAAFDLRRLEEPPFDGYAMPSKRDDPSYNPDGSWFMVEPEEDEGWLAASRVRCASPDARVYVAYAQSLSRKSPSAARFLQQVVLSPEMINGWNLLITEYEMDPAEMAREWIEQNPEIVEGWLAGT